MSWAAYVENLMEGGFVMDAAICGCESGKESVWASSVNGTFKQITQAEIRNLLTNDRNSLFATGVTIAGQRCTVVRDSLMVDGQNTMDLRTKATESQPETYSISIGKSKTAIMLVKGNKDAHGGKLNPKVFLLSEHLKKSGY